MIADPEMISSLPPDGGPTYNRLIFEKSPYLLQHARNPVNWFPWGEEAFRLAREEGKPVFLSIGYSTCHWCHVMEKESFEDQDVADLINEALIPIKVDREERPDLDQIYMAVCQSLTGAGGWPLTLFLTPDREPFYAGTYFPRESRFGRIGLLELVPRIKRLWEENRSDLLESARQITDHLRTAVHTREGILAPQLVQKAFEQLKGGFDPHFGGFGPAPKFPTPHNLIFLTRYWHATGEPRALEMAEMTLIKMRLGGIYDQVGFGFHRYSTDEAWILPHFEKMLYDQALLIMAYTEVYQATAKAFYAGVVREIAEYVLRDLVSPEGGFYSAEDADSEGEEGLFYLWTLERFRELLGEGSEPLIKLFNLRQEGNFIDQASGSRTGRNILYLKKGLRESAPDLGLPADELEGMWEKCRRQLFRIREERVHPLKDDKILTDWNGLMIAALAMAGSALAEPVYLEAARRALDFVWGHLRESDGGLLKRYRDGEAIGPAHLDDYAFLVWGLIELYQADHDPNDLERAQRLNQLMLDRFWDEEHGAFFQSSDDEEDVIVRSKESYDGALPSGNSAAFYNLVRLGRLTADPELESRAERIGEVFAGQINAHPQSFTQLMTGLLFAAGPSFEIVISGPADGKDTRAMLNAIQTGYFPQAVSLLAPADEPHSKIYRLIPALVDQPPREGKATAYICQGFSCNEPTNDIQQMLEQLNRK
jgi:uncharacterized protein YyaL (SSP411 family)